MPPFRSRWRLPAVALFASMAAQAGDEPAIQAPPDPLDPGATVPPMTYQSPFLRYRAQADGTPKAWKDANDTVGRIGGWRSYAREAAQGEAKAPHAPPSPGAGTPADAAGSAPRPEPRRGPKDHGAAPSH